MAEEVKEEKNTAEDKNDNSWADMIEVKEDGNKYPYHIVDIYGCPVYTPEYVSDNGTIKFDCQYFMKNGNDVHAVRHFPDILVKRGSVKLRKYVAKNYPREYLNLSIVFFYDPVTGYS